MSSCYLEQMSETVVDTMSQSAGLTEGVSYITLLILNLPSLNLERLYLPGSMKVPAIMAICVIGCWISCGKVENVKHASPECVKCFLSGASRR